MKLDRAKLKKEIHELYAREHAALGETGTYRLLEEARQWDLSDTLTEGGVLVFPHAGVQDYGTRLPLLFMPVSIVGLNVSWLSVSSTHLMMRWKWHGFASPMVLM